MIGFTLYYADGVGMMNNCSYPHEVQIIDEGSLRKATGRDYVCALYKNSYRLNANFIHANCLGLDCDNDHSENPEDWITPESVRQAFPDVTFAVHFSRNNNLPKRGKAARPKFHCLFQIDKMTVPDAYSNLKKRVHSVFPYFDPNALDAARFFFGTQTPEVAFYPGTLSLNEYLDNHYPDFGDAPAENNISDELTTTQTIPQGSRNTTMSQFAGHVLKRHGDTDHAYKLFLARADQCVPPLADSELSSIWHSAQRFYNRIQQQPGYVSPEKYNDPNIRYEPEDYTDVGQATVLARIFGNRLRYSPSTDYLAYNNVYWKENHQAAQSMVHELTQLQLDEARYRADIAWQQMVSTGTAELLAQLGKRLAETKFSDEQQKAHDAYNQAKAYLDFVMKRRDSKCIAATLTEARAMLPIAPKDLDADCFLLCTPVATYDLRKGMAGSREHRAEDYITKVTGVSPSSQGSKIWNDALNTFFCKDTELIQYVQMIAGLSSIGKVFFEAVIISYGDGCNGKSTFWNVIAHVLGTYSGNISADALTAGCRRNVKPELAEARGKRLLISSELEEDKRLDTSIVKQLTSTDDVFAEKKYKDPFAYTPSHTLVLYTNHLPKVDARDEGTWRRLIVIPFRAKIQGKQDKRNYADYLYQHAGGAILAWIIEGARMAVEHQYKIPEPACVRESIREYRTANDWLAQFLDECCTVGPTLQSQSGALYSCYRTHCIDTSENTRSTTDFYAALDHAGFTRKKTRAGIMIHGLQVKNERGEDI